MKTMTWLGTIAARVGVTAALSATALVAAVCLAIPATAAEPVTLGWVGPLSPPGNFAGGQEMQWAVQLGVDQINQAGGLLGQPLKVIYEDTKGQPAEGSAAAVRLINRDKVSAIFGEFHSSVALAEADIAHQQGVAWVGTDVWADKLTALQYPEVFRLAPSNSLVYVKVANWMVDSGFKHVAIIAENTDFGQDGARVVADILEQKHVDHRLVTIDLAQQDFTPALLRITHEGEAPDILQMVVAGQAQYQIVKQACQLGIAPTAKTKMLGSTGLLQKEVWEIDGDCAKYLLVVNVATPKSRWNDKAKAFAAAFEKAHNRAPTGVAMEAYDTLNVVVAAVVKAGSGDRKSVIAALDQIKYPGVNGTYTFPETKTPAWAYHQFIDVPFHLIQYTASNQAPSDAPIVYPKVWATTADLLPKN
jgi:branched-chain amino acid transport system substrate-binding protein